MKSTSKLTIFALAFLALAVSAYAQSPREQLQQMVGQLQKTPNDSVLREKIIKLAAEIKPAPVVPDEAIRYEGRGQFAFANAKSEADFLAAAKEYEKAVTAAPWVQNYYSDLCKIYEKAGKFEDAKRHCGFYLIGLTDPVQMTDVKRRIAGLEFGIEKAAPAIAEAEKVAAARREKTAREKAAYDWLLGEWRLKNDMRDVADGHAWGPRFETVQSTKKGEQILFRLGDEDFLRASLHEQVITWDHWKSNKFRSICPEDDAWNRVKVTISADKKSMSFSFYQSHTGTCGHQAISYYTLSR